MEPVATQTDEKLMLIGPALIQIIAYTRSTLIKTKIIRPKTHRRYKLQQQHTAQYDYHHIYCDTSDKLQQSGFTFNNDGLRSCLLYVTEGNC